MTYHNLRNSVKFFSHTHLVTKVSHHKVQGEIDAGRVLQKIDSPRIMKCHGYANLNNNPILLVFQFCGSGTLQDLLHIRTEMRTKPPQTPPAPMAQGVPVSPGAYAYGPGRTRTARAVRI